MLKTAGKCYKNTYEAPKNKSVRMQKQRNKGKKRRTSQIIFMPYKIVMMTENRKKIAYAY